MSDRYAHLVAFALEQPWALTPRMMKIVADVLARRLAHEEASEELLAEVTARRDARQRAGAVPAGVAVIPIHGVIAPRMNLLSEVSGGTTFDMLRGQVAEAVANPEVHTIVLDIDSPGGSSAGAPDLARDLRAAREKKEIVAQAEHLMASAAYWVGSNASRIVASPSAHVGSLGVYMIHDDLSAALAQLGIKRTYIKQGKHKVDGNETTPLTEDVEAHYQGLVDHSYELFVRDVATGRRVPPAAVRSGYGEGRVVHADDALTLGMIDEVAPLSETLARVAQPAPAGPRLGLAAASPLDRVWLRAAEQRLLRHMFRA